MLKKVPMTADLGQRQQLHGEPRQACAPRLNANSLAGMLNLRAERDTMEWHCTAYRDSVKVALFVSQFANALDCCFFNAVSWHIFTY